MYYFEFDNGEYLEGDFIGSDSHDSERVLIQCDDGAQYWINLNNCSTNLI